jgi:hypothetical protein
MSNSNSEKNTTPHGLSENAIKKIYYFFSQSQVTPQRSKSLKSKIIKLVRLKPSKMVSLASFCQIKEVNTDMKTAHLDLSNEELME